MYGETLEVSVWVTGLGPSGMRTIPVLATSPKVLTVIYGTEPKVGSRCPAQPGIYDLRLFAHTLMTCFRLAEDTKFETIRLVYTGVAFQCH